MSPLSLAHGKLATEGRSDTELVELDIDQPAQCYLGRLKLKVKIMQVFNTVCYKVQCSMIVAIGDDKGSKLHHWQRGDV